MWLIAGTIPEDCMPVYTEGIHEPIQIKNDSLLLSNGASLPVNRGTTALVATATLACEALGVSAPRVLLAGDTGKGTGSRLAYHWLTENIASLVANENLEGITFHYFFPDVDSHNRLYFAIDTLSVKPILVADAGFMYVAKMSGFAPGYDLFTPDIGELAFLADEKAPHPFYTRGFLSSKEDQIEELLHRAMRNDNSASNMIVKSKTDYIVCNGEVIERIEKPAVAAMECIGGTGDIVTGFVTAYLAAGFSVCESARLAAKTARNLAQFCNPNPACQVASLITQIKPMFKTMSVNKMLKD